MKKGILTRFSLICALFTVIFLTLTHFVELFQWTTSAIHLILSAAIVQLRELFTVKNKILPPRSIGFHSSFAAIIYIFSFVLAHLCCFFYIPYYPTRLSDQLRESYTSITRIFHPFHGNNTRNWGWTFLIIGVYITRKLGEWNSLLGCIKLVAFLLYIKDNK